MVSKPNPRFTFTEDQGPSVRRPVIRLTCAYQGEAHMYVFSPDEAFDAAKIITRHVMEGRLHPAAGMVLCQMIEGEDDG
jgi:hypothetical protein